jgi:DnaK suppressor protein
VATKQSPEPKADTKTTPVKAIAKTAAASVPAKVPAKATSPRPSEKLAAIPSAKTAAIPSMVAPSKEDKTSKKPVPSVTGKAAPSAPAKATMEKTAPKASTTSTKGDAKAPKVETVVVKESAPVKAKTVAAKTSKLDSVDGTVPAPLEAPEATLSEVKPVKAAKVPKATSVEAEAVASEIAKADKSDKPAKAEKPAKADKAVKVDKTADEVAMAPAVKEPRESKKAVKPPTAKSIAADAISALAVATPSAAALAENAAKATKPTPAPTPRVAAVPAKGSLVPVTPRLVKLVKAPALNPDDPFDGIEELSEGQFLSQQQEVLTNERRQYESSANMLQAEADQLAADMEPGDVQFDDESGEGTGVSVERERDIAMAQKANETVDEIDRALHRIGIGTYGYCIECHEMINRDRLRAMPFAVLCMKCKTGGLSRR